MHKSINLNDRFDNGMIITKLQDAVKALSPLQ